MCDCCQVESVAVWQEELRGCIPRTYRDRGCSISNSCNRNTRQLVFHTYPVRQVASCRHSSWKSKAKNYISGGQKKESVAFSPKKITVLQLFLFFACLLRLRPSLPSRQCAEFLKHNITTHNKSSHTLIITTWEEIEIGTCNISHH